jgi:recombination protein RecA
MREEHRKQAIREKLSRLGPVAADTISTGFRALDDATGGGLPRGRIVELFGGAGSGKTTLALQIVAAVQRAGGSAAWIDAEHAFDPAYANRLGVDIEQLPVAQPATAEQAFEIARQLTMSGAVDLVTIDSAAALAPEIELQTGIADGGGGAHSRALASGLRRLSRALRTGEATALFLNQTRVSEFSETSAGGPPLKLFAAARIALGPYGRGRMRFRVLKNKAGGSFREGDLPWRNGAGFVESP